MGDSLKVNDNSAKTAAGRFASMVNKELKGYYEVGQSSTGKYILNSTGDSSKMTTEQQALYKTLNEVMTSSKDVEFDAVDSSDKISEKVIIGDNGASVVTATPGRHTIDTEDMEKLGSGGLLTSQGALGHEMKEGFEMQQNGRTGAKTEIAHTMGIAIENLINGTTSAGGTFDSTNTILTVPVTNAGVTKNVIINIVNGQIQTIQNNIK